MRGRLGAGATAVLLAACRASGDPVAAVPPGPAGPAAGGGPPAAEDSVRALVVRWHATTGRFDVASQAGADSARAYLVTPAGIGAYGLADGAPRWHAVLAGGVPEVVVSDGRQVVVGTRTVFALDARTGAVRWTARPPGDVSTTVPAQDDARVYVGTAVHGAAPGPEPRPTVLAYDREGGQLRWSAPVGAAWEHRAGVTGLTRDGPTLYATATQCTIPECGQAVSWVIALDAATGAERWRLRVGDLGKRTLIIRPVAVAGGLLLAPDWGDNTALAVDPAARRVAWRTAFRRGAPGPSTPPLVDDRGVAYVGSADTYVYALDPATGAVRWESRVGGSVFGLARCRGGVVAQVLGLAGVRTADGRGLGPMLLGTESEAAVGNLVASGGVVVAATTRGLAAVDCQ